MISMLRLAFCDGSRMFISVNVLTSGRVSSLLKSKAEIARSSSLLSRNDVCRLGALMPAGSRLCAWTIFAHKLDFPDIIVGPILLVRVRLVFSRGYVAARPTSSFSLGYALAPRFAVSLALQVFPSSASALFHGRGHGWMSVSQDPPPRGSWKAPDSYCDLRPLRAPNQAFSRTVNPAGKNRLSRALADKESEC